MNNPQNGKDLFDYITLIIAAWGAGLATFLGLRELTKEKRIIKILLEHVSWVEGHQITITNSGHRPITIIEIGMDIYYPKIKTSEMLRKGAYWADEVNTPKFPFTLTDGDAKTFTLSQFITNELNFSFR
jgi:hypothetical protein